MMAERMLLPMMVEENDDFMMADDVDAADDDVDV